jgi:two-component system, OmpR family, sensor histidine kinase SenX3
MRFAVQAAGLLAAFQGTLFGRASRRRAEAEARAAEATAEGLRHELGRLEEDLRAMSTILSSMDDGVLLLDADGHLVFANDALAVHLGSRPLRAAGVFPIGLQEAIRAASEQGRPVAVEVETGSSGRWLRGSATPVGEDGAVLLVVQDVTEPRRVDAVRRDFVANASHELKTPAASIQAAAETIRTAVYDDPSVVPRFAAQLEREAARLSRIVSDLLDLSRLEGGSQLDGEVSLSAILREERDRFLAAAAQAGVELELSAAAQGRVRGSGRDLALLLRNLVDNAINYTKREGHVRAEVCDAPGEIVLTVSDSGIGIPTRELPRVFERFYRVDRARSRDTGGTGLGLSIVRHVVENHGGSVEVESELGRGSTFTVRLPAAG